MNRKLVRRKRNLTIAVKCTWLNENIIYFYNYSGYRIVFVTQYRI